MFSPRETFQTLSQVLVVSRNVNKYGVSTLAVSESWQKWYENQDIPQFLYFIWMEKDLIASI